jgi:hypothetical protein
MVKLNTNEYNQDIEFFLSYMRGKLERAWEQESKGNEKPLHHLYNEATFQITFEGVTLELGFGACEFQNLEDALQNILDEVGY